jgi:hypothetical protein
MLVGRSRFTCIQTELIGVKRGLGEPESACVAGFYVFCKANRGLFWWQRGHQQGCKEQENGNTRRNHLSRPNELTVYKDVLSSKTCVVFYNSSNSQEVVCEIEHLFKMRTLCRKITWVLYQMRTGIKRKKRMSLIMKVSHACIDHYLDR